MAPFVPQFYFSSPCLSHSLILFISVHSTYGYHLFLLFSFLLHLLFLFSKFSGYFLLYLSFLFCLAFIFSFNNYSLKYCTSVSSVSWVAIFKLLSSVPDPDPNPDPDLPDPHVFGPLGSGSFYHQAKIVRKTLILTVLWLLLDFLSFKNNVNVFFKK